MIVRLHVFADLRPYICTFASCEKELAQFPTRAAWADHEFTEHRVIRSWSCPECAKQCDSEIEWVLHLEKCHQRTFLGPKYQVAKKMAYKTRAKPTENEECPLCQVIPGKSRREFVKHVGRHMEEIALIALPRDNDGESEVRSTSTESEFGPSATPVARGSEMTEIDPGRSRGLQGSESIVAENNSTDGQAPRGPSAPISTSAQDGLGSGLMPCTSASATIRAIRQSDHDIWSPFEPNHSTYDPSHSVLPASDVLLQHFSCKSLTIGAWRYVGGCEPFDLLVYHVSDQACLVYDINKELTGYKIVCPFAYIDNISLENEDSSQDHSARQPGLMIELNRPPNFFMNLAGTERFLQCEDFTGNQQASRIMVHRIEVDPRLLQHLLPRLKFLYSFQVRQIPRPNFPSPITNITNHAPKKPSQGSQEPHQEQSTPRYMQPTASSYWSVTEQEDFQKLVKRFGTDWDAIAGHMKSKNYTEVSNYTSLLD